MGETNGYVIGIFLADLEGRTAPTLASSHVAHPSNVSREDLDDEVFMTPNKKSTGMLKYNERDTRVFYLFFFS